MIPRVALREALSDPNLLGTAIAGDSWRSWRALLIAAMGEELSEDEREIFTKLTGRVREPLQRVDQFAAVIGRRGGKSKAIATVATYIAGLCDHSDALVPGERGVLLCVALDQRVAKIILDYAEACFERSPILKPADCGPNRRRVGADQRHYLGGPTGVIPQVARSDLYCGDRR